MPRIGRLLLLALAAGALHAATAVPTEYEQYMLELVNRARSDPDAEAARFGIDLNEGLPAGTISSGPKQPLAFHPSLQAAALEWTATMLRDDVWGHDPGWDQRIEDAGYVPIRTIGENLVGLQAGAVSAATIDRMHENLFVDAGVAGRGHRKNILAGLFREIGVGIDIGPYSFGGRVAMADTVLATQDLGARSGSLAGPFITGVVFRDGDGDAFYTPAAGEALGGLAVEAWQGATLAAATTALPTGGYALGVPAGTYDLRFHGLAGGVFVDHTVTGVTLGAVNVKVDAVDPAAVPSRRHTVTVLGPAGGSVAVLDGDPALTAGTSGGTTTFVPVSSAVDHAIRWQPAGGI